MSKTESAEVVASDDLFAFPDGDCFYAIRNESGALQMVMMQGMDYRWRLYRLGESAHFDQDQYRHDLLERNGVPTQNIRYANAHAQRPARETNND